MTSVRQKELSDEELFAEWLRLTQFDNIYFPNYDNLPFFGFEESFFTENDELKNQEKINKINKIKEEIGEFDELLCKHICNRNKSTFLKIKTEIDKIKEKNRIHEKYPTVNKQDFENIIKKICIGAFIISPILSFIFFGILFFSIINHN